MEQLYNIIPAHREHLEEAVRIAIEAWTPIRESFRKELGDDLYAGFFDNWQEKKRREVERQLMSGHGFVSVDGQRVIGFISYEVDEDGLIGTIVNNAVSHEYQGKGVGSAQYRYIQNDMLLHGLKFVKVVTGLDDAHTPARHAYRKAGFERCLQSVCYYKEL